MSLSDILHLHRVDDPERPLIPKGGSRNEALALLLVLGVFLILVGSFWFQATR